MLDIFGSSPIDKKVKNWLDNNGIFYLSFLFVFGYLIFALIIPFMRYNAIVNWDMTGLYFSAWYERYFMFPDPIGWNPFFFLGYPQHQFYNPLFAYLTAALAYVIPLIWSFKILFAATLILMPISFYYCARAFKFSKTKSAVTMAAMFSILFFFPYNHYGGNMYSTFNVGLIAHSLGMALFFFYIGNIQKNLGKKIIIPSILFTLIILTHIIAAFAAAFVILSYIISKKLNKNNILWLIKHGALTTLLSAFWVLPFVAKRTWLEAYPIGGAESPFIYLVAFALLLVVFFKKQEDMLPIVMFIVLILIFSFINTYIYPIPIHLYRFTMYIYVLIPFLFMHLFNKEKTALWLIIIICSAVAIATSLSIHPEGEPAMHSNQKLENLSTTGRNMVLATLKMETSPHVLQHQIPREYNVHAIRGLYVESAKNSKYIFYLEQEMEPTDSLVWGTALEHSTITSNKTKILSKIDYQFNIFNVHKLFIPKGNISAYKLEQVVNYSAHYSRTNQTINYSYYLYNVGNSSLIEVLNYTPRNVSGDWRNETINWFLSENITQGVIVNEPVPKYKGSGRESITIEEMTPTQEYVRFKVNNASGPVPVLIKISAFPNWHAYENGKLLKIYMASPYLMIVYAQGTVELKYENTPIDTIANIFSIIGLITLIALIILSVRSSKAL